MIEGYLVLLNLLEAVLPQALADGAVVDKKSQSRAVRSALLALSLRLLPYSVCLPLESHATKIDHMTLTNFPKKKIQITPCLT
jgi:hypothetical protein